MASRVHREFWGRAQPPPVYGMGGSIYIYSMDSSVCGVCLGGCGGPADRRKRSV